MATYESSDYKVYELQGMPPVVFGETYVVAVGINTSGPYFKGEYHIISQRPAPLAESFAWSFEHLEEAKPHLTADIPWIISESLYQAKGRLVDRLVQRAQELNAPNLLNAPVELRELAASPFAGCRIRGVFHPEMERVQRTTQSAALNRYLAALRQIPAMVSH